MNYKSMKRRQKNGKRLFSYNTIFAMELKDLTKGIVVRKLTRHDHPRGIKAQVQNKYGIFTGRIVYLLKDGKIIYGDK